jgi:signal transduction histidine kinase
MDQLEILEKVRALSTCGTLVLNTKEDIIFADGIASEKLLSGKDPSDNLPLLKLDLPGEVLGQLCYSSKTAFASGKKRSMSAVIPVLNQPRLWIFTFNPSFDPSGRPEAMIVSIYDTGDASLERSDGSRFPALADGTNVHFLPGSIVTLTYDDLKVQYLNATASASLGVRKDEVIGKPLAEILPRLSSGLLNDIVGAASMGEVVIRTESVSIPDLGVRYFRWMIAPSVRDGEKKITLMLSDVTDLISDRFKEMSTSIFQESQMLRTIIDTIPIGLVIVESNGQVWLSNHQADELWPPEGNGNSRTFSSFEAFDDRGRKIGSEELPLYKALQSDIATNGQTIETHLPSGEIRNLLTSAAPLRSADGKLLGGISVFQDITDQKRDEEKKVEQSEALKRSNDELQQFAYVASHDLQEPLRMVTSYLGLMEKKFGSELNPQAREYMSFAVDGSLRMKKLIDDLLQFSRIDSRPIDLEEVDMGKVARAVVEDLAASINDLGTEVAIDSMPVIHADKAQMKQLLTYLLSNAIKFHNGKPPRVEISIITYGDEYVFSVKDNGIGIDEKYADKLFKMFSRLHTKEEYPGTGIGLAMAKKIVERHGGRIWFESELGKGTTFFFTINTNMHTEGRSVDQRRECSSKTAC